MCTNLIKYHIYIHGTDFLVSQEEKIGTKDKISNHMKMLRRDNSARLVCIIVFDYYYSVYRFSRLYRFYS